MPGLDTTEVRRLIEMALEAGLIHVARRGPWLPAAGIVLYVCAVPSMTKGATIANIGVVTK